MRTLVAGLVAATLGAAPAMAQVEFYAGPGPGGASLSVGPGDDYDAAPREIYRYRHYRHRYWRSDDFNSSYNRWRREGYPYFWTDQ